MKIKISQNTYIDTSSNYPETFEKNNNYPEIEYQIFYGNNINERDIYKELSLDEEDIYLIKCLTKYGTWEQISIYSKLSEEFNKLHEKYIVIKSS